MADKKNFDFDDLFQWQKNTQDIFNNFSNFVNETTKDLTPDEKALVDKEMEKLNNQDIQESIKQLNQMIQEQMSKFKV